MMIGWSFFESPAMILLLALHVALELDEGGAVGRVQHLAAELDGHLRRIALHRGEERRLDALQFLARFLDLLLEQAAERLDETISEQDAEERADQGGADHAAQHRRRLADRAH